MAGQNDPGSRLSLQLISRSEAQGLEQERLSHPGQGRVSRPGSQGRRDRQAPRMDWVLVAAEQLWAEPRARARSGSGRAGPEPAGSPGAQRRMQSGGAGLRGPWCRGARLTGHLLCPHLLRPRSPLTCPACVLPTSGLAAEWKGQLNATDLKDSTVDHPLPPTWSGRSRKSPESHPKGGMDGSGSPWWFLLKTKHPRGWVLGTEPRTPWEDAQAGRGEQGRARDGPAACGRVNSRSSLLLKKPRTHRGDGHTALTAPGISAGAALGSRPAPLAPWPLRGSWPPFWQHRCRNSVAGVCQGPCPRPSLALAPGHQARAAAVRTQEEPLQSRPAGGVAAGVDAGGRGAQGAHGATACAHVRMHTPARCPSSLLSQSRRRRGHGNGQGAERDHELLLGIGGTALCGSGALEGSLQDVQVTMLVWVGGLGSPTGCAEGGCSGRRGRGVEITPEVSAHPRCPRKRGWRKQVGGSKGEITRTRPDLPMGREEGAGRRHSGLPPRSGRHASAGPGAPQAAIVQGDKVGARPVFPQERKLDRQRGGRPDSGRKSSPVGGTQLSR